MATKLAAEVDHQAILQLSDLAVLTPWTYSELHRRLTTPDGGPLTKDYTGTEAYVTLPGGIHVQAHRRVEGAGWVVYRRHLDKAIDDAYHANLVALPDPEHEDAP